MPIPWHASCVIREYGCVCTETHKIVQWTKINFWHSFIQFGQLFVCRYKYNARFVLYNNIFSVLCVKIRTGNEYSEMIIRLTGHQF